MRLHSQCMFQTEGTTFMKAKGRTVQGDMEAEHVASLLFLNVELPCVELMLLFN